ncbi:MAG: WHG domain-containing protein [Acidimicrobiales bacterium]|nr:WHG domain-containing protein [Acidimicrobiales bacterium]
MARIRIDLEQVLAAAVVIVDRGGLAELSLSSVALHLGVRPSALYTHVAGSDGLHYVVAVHATTRLTSSVRNAAVGVAGRDALLSMALAYREYAVAHPGQYAATLVPPTDDHSELVRANAELVALLAQVFATLGCEHAQAQAAAQALRTGLHGFVALEVTGAKGDDEQFAHLVDLLTHRLPA